MLSRRKFIRFTVIGASAASAGFIGQTSRAGTFEDMIVKLLSTDLTGLNVKQVDIQSYAREAAHARYQRFHFAGVQLLCIFHLNPFKALPLPFTKKYKQLRSEIVGSFLLSTDFFYNGMDEAKEITYSGVQYNPYIVVCGNPFSGLAYRA